MKRTKIHNVVFQMLVVMIVTGSLQLLLKNGSAAKGGNATGAKKISLADITGGDDSEIGVLKLNTLMMKGQIKYLKIIITEF